MTDNKQKFSPEDNKMLKSVFWRTLSVSASWNYETMQALGFTYSMIPVIRRFIKSEEEQKKALVRQFKLFNTTPTMCGFISGISASMEKQASQDTSFDTNSINAVKVSLMGPFAGIGDTIFWAALRVITLSIGISFSLTGNILGVFLHLMLFNAIAFIPRYYGVLWGYDLGGEFIRNAAKSGILGHVTKGAGVVGLMAIGAMVCNMVRVPIALTLNLQGTELVVQDTLNSIFPFMLPLALTFFCFKLLTKGVKPYMIMLGMMVVGVIGKIIGVF